jgi:hypothetical protein
MTNVEIPTVLPSQTKCRIVKKCSVCVVHRKLWNVCDFWARWLSHADTSLKHVNRFPPTHSTFVKIRKETLHLTMSNTARFEASAAASLRSSLFWDVTQPRFMIGYRRFGTACQSSLLRSSSKRWAWAFKMAPTSCPEKSIAVYRPTMCNIPQKRIPPC